MRKKRMSPKGSGSFRKDRREGVILFGLARKEKVKREGKKPEVRLRFHWKRLGITLAVLGLVGWLSCGAALFFYFKTQRGYEEVSYFKMLILPLRLDQHRREMGDYFIDRGIKEINEGEFRRGFHHLRSGLARSPANAEARLMLATIFNSPGFGERRLAIEALAEGFRYADKDPQVFSAQYIGFLFLLLSLDQQDQRAIELADELSSEVSDRETRAFLQIQAVGAERKMGMFTAAYERLQRNQLQRSSQGLLLMARIFWQAGEPEWARYALERGVETFPRDRLLLRQLYEFLIQEEEWEKLLSHTSLRLLSRPDEDRSASARLYAYSGLGMENRILPSVRDLLSSSKNPAVPGWILLFAVENIREDVAMEVFQHLQDADRVEVGHIASVSLVLARSENPQQSLVFIGEIREEKDLDLETMPISAIEALAHQRLGRESVALTKLQEALNVEKVPVDSYLLIAKSFEDAGFEDFSRRVLARSLEEYPEERDLLTEMVSLTIEEQELGFTDYIETLLSGRVPDRDFLEEIRVELSSDQFLFLPNQGAIVQRIDEIIDESERLSSSMAIATSGTGNLELLEADAKREFFQSR